MKDREIVSLEQFEKLSYLSGENDYIDSLYDQYLVNPDQVTTEWRQYFDTLGSGKDAVHSVIRDRIKQSVLVSGAASVSFNTSPKQEAVDQLIDAYRRYGHFQANIDPLGQKNFNSEEPRLELTTYGLSSNEYSEEFNTRGLLPQPVATLKIIHEKLKSTYTGTCGFEYVYIDNQEEREWLQQAIEGPLQEASFSNDEKIKILEDLMATSGLEKYLDVKYPGQKRFSIEGLDSLIPLLNKVVASASQSKVEEVRFGMAHRGRLNIMMNVLGQEPQELFQIFDGVIELGMTTGDVKYHMGYSNDIATPYGEIHVSMAFNPSHLEYINPVAMGVTRARQDLAKDNDLQPSDSALLILLHGDSAFVGEGIVMEGLNMSKTTAYDIGGVIHVVTNNQLGFTTSLKEEIRTGHYATSPAKMIESPIFHVNADDVEMVVKIAQLAYDYRMTFHKDVVIDLVGYRKHGHQEVDEPRATQPGMYKIIDKHESACDQYAHYLEAQSIIDMPTVKSMQDKVRDDLDNNIPYIKSIKHDTRETLNVSWSKYIGQTPVADVDTSVPKDQLIEIEKNIQAQLSDVTMHRSIKRMYQSREQMTAGEKPLDWGYAETLAYASLLRSGNTVRLVGEDSCRGTFYHRNAVVSDQDSYNTINPLCHLSEDQAPFYLYNSTLSEAGALGFEYGYAMTDPESLVIWEAQFGDFANVAQVIIDQFISSAWQKWQRLSGLVMLLPHGYEGMGPEHSSARLERFLQLCAQSNMQVCIPTTPSQIFHLLRRQVLGLLRTPLVVMTPKSLLRNPMAVSSLDDLTVGSFKTVIAEVDEQKKSKVERVIACSGKIYYELLQKRREHDLTHIAIIRIEQLYPFPYEELKAQLEQYPKLKELLWCQEEPKNQGAWFVTRHRLEQCMPKDVVLMYSSRTPMAAPSAGYPALHKKHQSELVKRALNIDNFEPFIVR